VATGIKRTNNNLIVFSYQGDGDLAAIGTAEMIHAACRAENITIIFVNNAVYGMTGGQMAPTTLLGQKTDTTPKGRESSTQGYPLKVCELLSTIEGVSFLARFAVNEPKNIIKTQQAIKEAFLRQMNNQGFSLVEILSPCPVCWHLSPKEACQWISDYMIKVFPLGIFKS
jgi:2-oxoglutarate ferredoxin oxidoreductase subunit beta